MFPLTCDMNHTSRIDPETTWLADLSGGLHVLWTCPICSRYCASVIDATVYGQFKAAGAGVVTSLEAGGKGKLRDLFAVRHFGPLTRPKVDFWAAALTQEGDALIRAWLNEEVTA